MCIHALNVNILVYFYNKINMNFKFRNDHRELCNLLIIFIYVSLPPDGHTKMIICRSDIRQYLPKFNRHEGGIIEIMCSIILQ